MITWESKPTIDSIRRNPTRPTPCATSSTATTTPTCRPSLVRRRGGPAGRHPTRSGDERELVSLVEGTNGNTSGQFVQMWQHVWNIFQAAGANST